MPPPVSLHAEVEFSPDGSDRAKDGDGGSGRRELHGV
jgi:hypothetical protein